MDIFVNDIDKLFSNLFEFINSKYDIPVADLENIMRDAIAGKNTEKILSRCTAELKSGDNAGKQCQGKISVKSSTGKYCSRHLKLEESAGEKQIDDGILFKRNKAGNLVFGKTRLVLKSETEKYVIGLEQDDGSIIDLDEEGIELCKKKMIKYVRGYSLLGL